MRQAVRPASFPGILHPILSEGRLIMAPFTTKVCKVEFQSGCCGVVADSSRPCARRFRFWLLPRGLRAPRLPFCWKCPTATWVQSIQQGTLPCISITSALRLRWSCGRAARMNWASCSAGITGSAKWDWVAVPLVPYLYGVEVSADVPATMDKLTALRMRDLYRREHLQMVAPNTPEGGMPQGNWYELVGSAFDRTIYGFQVSTTQDQDASLIAYFNDRPNVTRYQGAFRNCADFTRVVINRLYPHAIRRNYVADFGLTTPKSVARSLVHYAKRHPELELQLFRVPQVDGTISRSMSIQGVTGSLLTRYAVPMTILSPHMTAVVLVAYIGKGRFAVPSNAPVLDVAALETAAQRSPGTEAVADAVVPAQEPAATETSTQSASGAGGDSVGVEFFAAPGCDLCDSVPFLP